MQPVAPKERLPVIDVLRGVALIGIIVANMRGFNSPMEAYMQPQVMWDTPADRLTQACIDCFVSGKFIAIFAALFGIGFAIQMARAGERRDPFARLHVRRMIGLALLGVAHVLLLWWGDILLTYAVVGLALLWFRNSEQSSVMLWGMMLYWAPVFLFLGFTLLSGIGGSSVPAGPEASPEAIQDAIGIYTGTDFGAVLRQRLADWQVFNASAPVFMPRVLGFFLFGVWIWREDVLRNLGAWLGRFRRWLPWLLVAGVSMNALYVAINHLWTSNPMAPTALNFVMWIAASIGMPALSLFYCLAVVLLFQSGLGRKLLTPFALVGRMALTNYLAQSLICTAIFYGWGLGLFGQVGPLAGLALAVAVYAAQAGISAVWLRRFRYGPVEWLWRSMTYGRLQPR